MKNIPTVGFTAIVLILIVGATVLAFTRPGENPYFALAEKGLIAYAGWISHEVLNRKDDDELPPGGFRR